MRKKSLRKQATLAMAVLIILFTGLFLGFGYAYFRSSYAQYLRDLQIISNQYSESLNRDIRQANTQVEQYFSESSYYREITSGKVPDYEWVKGVHHIKIDLTTQAATLPFTGGFFFYDRYRDSFFSSFHDYNDSILMLNNYLKEISRTKYTDRRFYGHEEFLESTFLVYYLSLNSNPMGYILNLTDYIHVEEGMEVLFLTLQQNGGERICSVITAIGNELLTEEEALKILEAGEEQRSIRGNLTTIAEISEFPGLYMLTVSNAGNKFIWRQKSFWALLIFLPAVFLLIYLYFLKMLKRTLLNPITHLYNRLKQTQEQDIPALPENTTEIMEYQEINDQIDNMLQQITILREEKLKEQIRTKEALLQYYQVQTNPHFFLSCLNTVSSLLERGRGEMANDLIQALSNHFRYIFRGNRTLVSLQEELKAAQDYCDIFRIRSGFPILLTCEVSKETDGFMIPLLSVMTFVENSVKHFGKRNTVLAIRIQAGVQSENGVRSINIRITDNGRGFTEESLKELNSAVNSYEYMSSHVGVRNLKYRMNLLYGEKAEWYFYNSPYGAAVAELRITEVSDERVDH